MSETTELKSNDVVFFLGAGASVAAGVPTTYDFLKQFVERLPKGSQKELCNKIVGALEASPADYGQAVDIELFIEALDSLGGGLGRVGELYLPKDSIPKTEPETIKEVLGELKAFIREKALVAPVQARYLDPIWSLADNGPVDVFSTNYDTAIEQICYVHRKRFSDGFELEWRPEAFESSDLDLRLYKLHGSVLWYESEHARYLKIPISPQDKAVELFTGEKAQSLMIYPMRKWQYAEPLLEIMMLLKRRIEDAARTRYVIVGGYSFRDEYIKKLFWDAFRQNKNLTMVLVDPQAMQIYNDRLKEYRPGLPSSMEGRVVCWPGRFEKVLPLLRNDILLPLRTGQTLHGKILEMERRGDPGVDWSPVAQNFLDCGFYDGFLDAQKRTGANGASWDCIVQAKLLGFSAILAAQHGEFGVFQARLKELSEFFQGIVSTAEVKTTPVSYSGGMGLQMVLRFKYPNHSNESGRRTFEALKLVASFGKRLLGCRLEGNSPDSDQRIASLTEHCAKLAEHLEAVENSHHIDHEMVRLYGNPSNNIFGMRAQNAFQKLGDHDLKTPLPEDFQKAIESLEKQYLSSMVQGIASVVSQAAKDLDAAMPAAQGI